MEEMRAFLRKEIDAAIARDVTPLMVGSTTAASISGFLCQTFRRSAGIS